MKNEKLLRLVANELARASSSFCPFSAGQGPAGLPRSLAGRRGSDTQMRGAGARVVMAAGRGGADAQGLEREQFVTLAGGRRCMDGRGDLLFQGGTVGSFHADFPFLLIDKVYLQTHC